MKTNNTLDKFVLKRAKKNDKDNILDTLPKKKDIKLNDPSLKLKGIAKKKNNLNNKYEERSKKTNKRQETRNSQQNEKESENQK